MAGRDALEPVLNTVTALPSRVTLDEMNRPLTGPRGRALQCARESDEQAEKGTDTGEDALMKRIL